MSTELDTLKEKLKGFGLDQQQSSILIYLFKNGRSSVTSISKSTKIPRSTVYRILDKILLSQLVTEVETPRGKRYEIGNINGLETIIEERETELKDLKSSYEDIQKVVKRFTVPEIAKTKVLSYQGIEGLKQMTWNSSKAQKELRIIEISSMGEFLDFGFAEKTRTEFILNKVKVKELSNQKRLNEWTEITQFVQDYWSARYIPKDLFEITFEILIYNNVYAMYNYQNNDIMGVEIYNEQLANMQKQIFDYIWENATPYKVENNKGKCSL
jgi:sugar-specific transcriptional regulator TrmB